MKKIVQLKISLLLSLLGLLGITCSSCRCEYGGDEDVEWEERNVTPHYSGSDADSTSYDSDSHQ